MHYRRGTGRGVRGMTTTPYPVCAFPRRHPLFSVCAALTLLSVSGCVNATDPTLMAGNQAFAPSQTFSLAPVESAEGSAPDSGESDAFPIAQTEQTATTSANAGQESGTMTAMAADPGAAGGIDALNQGITQSAQTGPMSNLYSTEQAAAAPVEAGDQAPGLPVPSPSPERQLSGADPVEVAALGEPAEQYDAAQALDQTTTATAAPNAADDQTGAQQARPVALAEPPKKKSFFGRLFGSEPTPPKPVRAAAPQTGGETEVVSLRNDIRVARASTNADPAPSTSGDSDSGGLPGVRMSSLFEIQAGNDEDGENAQGVEVASAAGLARLAPNGLHVQTEKVDIACLKPQLVRTLKSIERHYGKPVVVTSGFRSPKHNRRIGGARNSRHTSCEAADIQVSGVSKWDLAAYVRSMPGRGGVGTYCHTRSVHVDIGTKRDWNWRCRRRK
jgi:uncharacterized protein YcbK (DUF882 family)